MQVEADDLRANSGSGANYVDYADYAAHDALVLQSIMTNMMHVDSAHRQGYLRALSLVFYNAALGCVPAGADEVVLRHVLASLQVPVGGAHG